MNSVTLCHHPALLTTKEPNKQDVRIFQKSKTIKVPVKAPLGFVLSNIFPAC